MAVAEVTQVRSWSAHDCALSALEDSTSDEKTAFARTPATQAR